LTTNWQNYFSIFERCKINHAVFNNLPQPSRLCFENNYAPGKKGRSHGQFSKMQLIIYNLQDWVVVLRKDSNNFIERERQLTRYFKN
jgi:hypothetical protein